MSLAQMADATVDAVWSVDGVPLTTHGFGIVSRGLGRLAPPAMRGSNPVIPYRAGSMWVPKVVDSRIVPLSMWVIGVSPQDQSIIDQEQFDRNWQGLRDLLWRAGGQFPLTKRFRHNGAWVTATAMVEFSAGLNPAMNGPARAEFSVDLLLADPFFYGLEESAVFAAGESKVLAVGGDYPTRAVRASVTGPLSAPQFTNLSVDPHVWFRYGAMVNDSESADIDCVGFAARYHASGGSYGAVGNVAHSGDPFWMVLAPGDQQVQLSQQSGTGSAQLWWKPVFL